MGGEVPSALLFALSVGVGCTLSGFTPAKPVPQKVYECIVVGAGLSGLKCAHDLATKHGFAADDVLVLDAQDYVGGRVKQNHTFLPGVKIDLGAEILHGSDTLLNRFAAETGEEVEEIFCWAHGDGGPSEHRVNGGYGLYYFSSKKGRKRLLRFDDESKDFVKANEALWKLAHLKEEECDERLSFKDFVDREKLSADMKEMAYAGFSNTLCTNEHDLSLKQSIRWSRLWDGGAEGDFKFKNSYECLVNYLKKDCKQICVNTVVDEVDYSGDGPVTIRARRLSNGGSKCENIVYKAKSALMTASVHVLKTGMINFVPRLPQDKVDALECLEFHRVVKVIVKFRKVVFPKNLSGMIMSGENCIVPEVWFRDVTSLVRDKEAGVCYAVGFATSTFADGLAQMASHEEVCLALVRQLDEVFSHLRPSHVTFGDEVVDDVASLPSPSSQYISGIVQDWRAQHPFIGGGYGSPKAGKSVYYGEVLARPVAGRLFFAGEATNSDRPGATAHSALETGARAARELASRKSQR